MLRETVAVIRLELQCVGGATFADLDLTKLRVFLDGESSLTYALYESLCNHTCQVQLRPLGGPPGLPPLALPPACLQPVGFALDEGMLPYTPRSFLGYRLLQEYWSFPDKFLFVDLGELDQAARAGFGQGLEVVICLNRRPQFEQPLTPRTFRLGCTPIINLFAQRAEPIRVTQVQTEYRVIPDIARPTTTEVYTVESVTSISPYVEEAIRFQPFYSFKHAADREAQQVFWYTTRRPSSRQGDEGTEVYLSLVDLNFQPKLPAVETLTVHTTCTNRDLPGKLPFGGGSGELQMEGASPARIYCLTKPTETLRPTRRRGAQWRLISNLALNYLSLCEGGKEALQEILQLYNFADTAAIRQQIVGITNVTSRRVVGRPTSMPWNGVCRGLEVTIEFDEDNFVGSGVFLFASVLEKFLGLYASLNAFTQLVATSQQREEPVKRWPPRAGEQILL
jgi:type VI secretion system protein ImpG